mmetsp:Transcript_19755/g.59835  ORF Transcript_19755/g.59835 Transcript_19755/m.59835 type:complete len:114 (+) Transcript_19755:62-403(+)
MSTTRRRWHERETMTNLMPTSTDPLFKFPDEDEIEELRDLFLVFDRNGDMPSLHPKPKQSEAKPKVEAEGECEFRPNPNPNLRRRQHPGFRTQPSPCAHGPAPVDGRGRGYDQ